MKLIKLTRGKFAKVDTEDFEILSKYKWHFNRLGYADRNLCKKTKTTKHKMISMHRMIMKPESKQEVDHINGNGLDNRRSNLRLCSSSQNKFNRGKPKTNTSGYKGVSWEKDRNKWTSQIRVDGQRLRLGSFDLIADAVAAYNKASKKYHGKFSNVILYE